MINNVVFQNGSWLIRLHNNLKLMAEQYLIMDSSVSSVWFCCWIRVYLCRNLIYCVCVCMCVCVCVLQKAFWNPKTEASWERVYSCAPGGKRTCQFLFWKTPFLLYFSNTDTNTCISSICIEGVVCVCVAAGFCCPDCAFHSLFILLQLNKTSSD